MSNLKKLIKKLISKFKIIIKEKIPVFFQSKFGTNKIKRILSNIGIDKIEKFNVKQWHLGYRYYVGIYNGKRVFIKYNNNSNWIKHEIDIMTHIINNSRYLNKKIPYLYNFIITEKYGLLVEEFIEYKPLKYHINNESVIDNTKVVMQIIEIIKEFQKIGIMHADINSENVYLSEESDIYIIDFGFSIEKGKYDFSYIGNKHKQNLILFNLNSKNRIEAGYIDDAYSFLEICKEIDSNFISSNYENWLEINNLSNNLTLDIKEM